VCANPQVKDVEAKHRELVEQGVKFDSHGQIFWGYGAELFEPGWILLNLWDEVSMREKAADERSRLS